MHGGGIVKGWVWGGREEDTHFTRKTQSLLSKYTRNIKVKFDSVIT